MSLPVQTKQRWLVNTEEETEENTHGYIYGALLAPPNTTTSIVLSMNLEWTVTLSQPQQHDSLTLDAVIQPTSDAQVYAGKGQTTDGNTYAFISWSNHNPVTYNGAKERTIYLLPTGIDGFDKDGKSVKFYYAVWSIGTSGNLPSQRMVLFPTFTGAEEYQQAYSTGTLYHTNKDGPWHPAVNLYVVSSYTPMTLRNLSQQYFLPGQVSQSSQLPYLTTRPGSEIASETSSTTSEVLIRTRPRDQS